MAEQQSPKESKAYSHEIGNYLIKVMKEISIAEASGNNAQIKSSKLTGSKNYFAINWNGYNKTQYYIRLGHFLEFIQTNIIPSINNNPLLKLLKIDYNQKTNIIYTLPRQISSDPRICVFKANYRGIVSWGNNYELFPFIENDFIRSDNFSADYGQIMNVYFNMDYILNEIENQSKNNKGKVSLYSLLEILCNGWNKATGNYNNLEPIIDSDTNTIKIVDSVVLPDRDAILKELNVDASTETAYFDTFKYNYYSERTKIPHAGFIRDLNFNTTVGSNMATMITIGSTYQGYVVGEDATALSRMNAGLVDRFKETISYPEDKISTNESYPPLRERYKAAIEAFDTYVKNLSEYVWNDNVIEDFSSLQTQLLEYGQAEQIEIAAIQTIAENTEINQSTLPAQSNGGFLPFNLSLTMDGLSGMKVYQKFSIDTDFLPLNYPESLEFLIKGITNTIANDQWITDIESFATVHNPFAVSSSLRTNNSEKTSINSSNNFSTSSLSPNFPLTSYVNLKIAPQAQKDNINGNLLYDINQAAKKAGVYVTITTAITGHNSTTTSGYISRHTKGNAVDIAIINSVGSNGATNSTNGNPLFRELGNKFKNALVELGYLWNVPESGNSKVILWQTAGHYNHIHVSRQI